MFEADERVIRFAFITLASVERMDFKMTNWRQANRLGILRNRMYWFKQEISRTLMETMEVE